MPALLSPYDTASRAVMVAGLLHQEKVSACAMCANPRKIVTVDGARYIHCDRCGDSVPLPGNQPAPAAAPAAPRLVVDSTLSTGLGRRASSGSNNLTPEEKADAYADETLWEQRPTDADPTAIYCTSPESGQTYRLAYDPRLGRWRCPCAGAKRAAQGRCWHLIAFERNWLAALLPLVSSTGVRP